MAGWLGGIPAPSKATATFVSLTNIRLIKPSKNKAGNFQGLSAISLMMPELGNWGTAGALDPGSCLRMP